MRTSGKLMATSFIAGAAAAIYASKQINKNNKTTAAMNNTYESSNTISALNSSHRTNLTAAEANNFYSKAPNTVIDYNYDSNATSATSQTPYNVYIPNEQKSQTTESIASNTFSNISNSNPESNTSIKIDAI